MSDSNNKWINDPYTNKARNKKLVARSYFKLEEIDKKFNVFNAQTKTILDIGCAPGSWLQYCSQKVEALGVKDPTIIGFDLKRVMMTLPNTHPYEQDITDRAGVQARLDEHKIESFDLIVSDMAPDTIGMKDIDALRSVGLIEKTLWIYEKYLVEGGRFAIKVFMGPGFEELVRELKDTYGQGSIQVFKPKSCRKSSKETYIVKKK